MTIPTFPFSFSKGMNQFDSRNTQVFSATSSDQSLNGVLAIHQTTKGNPCNPAPKPRPIPGTSRTSQSVLYLIHSYSFCKAGVKEFDFCGFAWQFLNRGIFFESSLQHRLDLICKGLQCSVRSDLSLAIKWGSELIAGRDYQVNCRTMRSSLPFGFILSTEFSRIQRKLIAAFPQTVTNYFPQVFFPVKFGLRDQKKLHLCYRPFHFALTSQTGIIITISIKHELGSIFRTYPHFWPHKNDY